MVFNQVSNPQVDLGDQIVRLDYATRYFLSVFLTLPTYFEVCSP